MENNKKVSVFRLCITLGLLASIAAGLLACVNNLTKDAIAKTQTKKTNKFLSYILPNFDNDPAKEILYLTSNDNRKIKYYIAKKNNQIVGIAGEATSNKGFGGDITVMVGMNMQGVIKQVIVSKQNETAGLGTNVTDRKRSLTIWDIFGMGDKVDDTKLPSNVFLDGFTGKVLKNDNEKWEVEKDGGDVVAVTGATITSRAVTDATYIAVSTYLRNKTKF